VTTESEPIRFGTIGGVFTPCVLTILGVIMFLRFGQVVGQSGLWHGLAIVLGAKLITVLTTFSLSAIATNTRIKGGGAYFLISRSLGVEFGGVIGIVLFLAQAVSVSMYVIGFTEAFVATFPDIGLSFRSIATIVNTLTFICVFIGAGWTIKLQYGILAVLGLSLIAFFAGAIPHASLQNLHLNSGPLYSDGQSMFTMFALFFPAVTGIMAGANMSGDLKDPSRSIPLGTLAAVGVTALIYVAMAVALAAAAPRDALLGDALIVKSLSISPALITAGVFAATVSSALGSMMGAPRILQAFARDDIYRPARYFAAGSGASAEPRRATVLTFAIAQSGILLGDLNAIAPVITMFFMVTYGTLNLACFYEGISRNPSYRPRFRFSHWSLALAGAIGCGVVMLLINPLWAIVSVLLIGLLYFLISRAEIMARWGDIGSGVAFEKARKALLQLEDEYFHPKNWRPAIMALSGGVWNRLHLADYAHWMAAGHGIVTLAQLMPEVGENQIDRRRDAEKRLRKLIHEEGLSAFPVVVTESALSIGLESLLQAHGIGGMRPNTVLMGLPDNDDRWEEFCLALHCADRYERSIVLVDCNEDAERWHAPAGSIDVLWQGEEHGELMVLLGHLLKKNPEWRVKPLRVLAALPPKGDFESYRKMLEDTLNLARIDASVHVFSGDDLYVTLAKRTGNSAALFIQFNPPTAEEQDAFIEWTKKLSKLVPDIIYVHSSRGVSLQA
jgi:amino acid transporter